MRTLFCVMGPLFTALIVSAQTATISGTVMDPSKSVIAGASVQISSITTGAVHKAVTDSNGLYNFTLLPPGSYQLQVSSHGFQTLTQEQVILQVGEQAKLDLTLQ